MIFSQAAIDRANEVLLETGFRVERGLCESLELVRAPEYVGAYKLEHGHSVWSIRVTLLGSRVQEKDWPYEVSQTAVRMRKARIG